MKSIRGNNELWLLPIIKKHAKYWILYALYFYLMNLLENTSTSISTMLVTMLYFAMIFYSIWLILEKFFKAERIWAGVCCLIVFYLFSFTVCYYMLYTANFTGMFYGEYLLKGYKFTWPDYIQSSLVLHGNFSLLGILYYQYQRKLHLVEEKNVEMEKRLAIEELKVKYEYAALAGQVSPHLMANIFLRWQEKFDADKHELGTEIEQMYELMLFYMKAHQSAGFSTILLEDEVMHVRRFVSLQMHTSTMTKQVVWNVSGSLMRFDIPPTTLLTLVKNAFKHGDLTDPNNPLCIDVLVQHDSFMIIVENKLCEGGAIRSHGQGLQNLRRRLDIKYGSNYYFDTYKYNKKFFARLRVQF